MRVRTAIGYTSLANPSRFVTELVAKGSLKIEAIDGELQESCPKCKIGVLKFRTGKFPKTHPGCPTDLAYRPQRLRSQQRVPELGLRPKASGTENNSHSVTSIANTETMRCNKFASAAAIALALGFPSRATRVLGSLSTPSVGEWSITMMRS